MWTTVKHIYFTTKVGIETNNKMKLKGHLLCKIHFLIYFIHTYVFLVCKETYKVSENTTLSLFLLTIIQTCCGHDDTTKMWAGLTLNSWQRSAHVWPNLSSLSETLLYQKQCIVKVHFFCLNKFMFFFVLCHTEYCRVKNDKTRHLMDHHFYSLLIF